MDTSYKWVKQVDIGFKDKREITMNLAGTASGCLLPLQIIYMGKTDKCHPSVKFSIDWHVTQLPNHWSNEETKTLELQITVMKSIHVGWIILAFNSCKRHCRHHTQLETFWAVD